MATLESFFATDADAEQSGKWFPIGPFRFKLARSGGANNAKWRRVSAAKWEPLLRDIELKTLDEKTELRTTAEVYAEAIVLDWEGVSGDDGQPLPCTRENVIEKLTALPELFDRIVKAATRFENYKAALRETAAGN